MIRVLVVEDSPTARQLVVSLLEQDPEIEIVGQATDGRQAVDMAARLEPDVITMDVIMPDLDGLQATRLIMAKRPTPIIIVTDHVDSPELNVVFEAMKAGALDVIAKPSGFGEEEKHNQEQGLVARIKNLAGVSPKPI